MRFAGAGAALLLVACASERAPWSGSLWVLREGSEWCGYSDEAAFQVVADGMQSVESGRLTYEDGRLSEVTYNLLPESGDWLLADVYRRVDDGWEVQREVMLFETRVRVDQRGRISRGGNVELTEPRATLPDGSPIGLESIGMPSVEVAPDPEWLGFVSVGEGMVSRQLDQHCLAR
jgi:hypothetical protein